MYSSQKTSETCSDSLKIMSHCHIFVFAKVSLITCVMRQLKTVTLSHTKKSKEYIRVYLTILFYLCTYCHIVT